MEKQKFLLFNLCILLLSSCATIKPPSGSLVRGCFYESEYEPAKEKVPIEDSISVKAPDKAPRKARGQTKSEQELTIRN